MKKQLLAAISALILVFTADSDALAHSFPLSVTVGAQGPASLIPGESAVFPVTVSRTGAGRIYIDLACSGLPAGATASFSPNPVTFTGNSPSSATSSLVISTTSAIASGVYNFTVTARDSRSQRSLTTTGVLKIGTGGKTSVSSQTVTSVEMLPDGTARITLKAAPATTYQLQATTNLVSPSWVAIGDNTTDATGVCAFIDQDAASYPSRFYRTVAVN